MLEHLDARDVTVGGRQAALVLGRGPLALEVVTIQFPARPRVTELRELFKERVGRRATPVLVVGVWGDGRAAVYGPTERNPVELLDLPYAQIGAICERALEAEGRHQAIRLIHQLLPQLETPIPGLRNGGLFAMQELRHGVPRRGDWRTANERARGLRGLRGRGLIGGLEFVAEDLPGPGLVLFARDRKTAIAVLLDQPEEIDASSDRFDGVSPVSYALAKADREHLDYVMVVAASTIRLYPARPGVGSGRRGRSETFVELNLDLLSEDEAAYLWLLFSADALREGGTFRQILERSEDYAADLGSRLRDRVYREVVPRLAKAVVAARPSAADAPSQEDLDRTYQVALRILYRLLFVAYAEDRDLLPLHASKAYREHSLKRIAQRLADARRQELEFGDENFYWTEVSLIWRAVSRGNAAWDVPAYNGTLFASDAETSPLGAEIERLSIPDRDFAPALAALLLDRTEEGVEGPVDFRSLGVREFGTIYEGLLESELSLAETDLSVDPKTEAYLPAKAGDDIVVGSGEVYLHNRSGARKSTGSYYTKAFAVEHLLDRAVEPALAEHLDRLSGMSEREAGRRFFEFRVTDIAMGSGHFLVAAIDRIERRLVSYLAERPLPDVKEELARLRRTALENLGEEWTGGPIEDAQLLRRQVARRCIFGVDLNPMAVELARLSIWIHTFVPGLPLSLLDRNLVQGNSLVGIATFEEASELFRREEGELLEMFALVASERLAGLREPLEKLARLTDASDAEIKEARALHEEMRQAMRGDTDLFTILTASRTNEELQKAVDSGQVATLLEGQGDAFGANLVRTAESELAGLDVLHFPLAFPHVFLGSRKGFDVILGNAPWEEATLEEDAFWARHFPGLRSMPQREQEAMKAHYRRDRPDLVARFEEEKAAAAALRDLLTAGAYPGMGTGDPDLYKAFVWRFWHLVSPDGGRIGVVLPRSALAAKGSGDFRKAMLEEAEVVDLTMLVNNKTWVFEEVHPQYTIGLAAISRRDDGGASRLLLSGPYPSLERFGVGVGKEPATFYGHEVAEWNDTASLPLLPSEASVEVFAQLRRSPRLDLDDGEGWRARPHAELHATNDKKLMDLESSACPDGFWPVFKGESFDLWTPDTGTYYAWADPRGGRSRAAEEAHTGKEPLGLLGVRDGLADRPENVALPRATNRVSGHLKCHGQPDHAGRAPARPDLPGEHGPVLPVAPWKRARPGIPTGDPVLDSPGLVRAPFRRNPCQLLRPQPLPHPRPKPDDPLRLRAIALAGRLAAPDDRFAAWATKVGVDCGPLDEDTKNDHVHELDAVVAHLYGLGEPHLTHVFETFHEGWDYEERLRSTLKHYRAWKGRR